MASTPGMRAIGAMFAFTFELASHSADTLAVRVNGVWLDWWSADHAPALLERRRLANTINRGENRSERAALRSPARTGRDLHPSWTIDLAGDTTAVAVNAEEFKHAQPWEWLIHYGTELAPPGVGPLSMAFLIDSSGGARLVPSDFIAAASATGGIGDAFQAYPTFLDGDGAIPKPLFESGHGVNLKHRDSRVVIGELRDGHLIIVMTASSPSSGRFRFTLTPYI
ncbi:MAG: hypothetical protein H0U66_01505 [Gemmatimonadaceae bacterium]|nr:hypothetical protein [Gemmatimonadaceae bacterium]